MSLADFELAAHNLRQLSKAVVDTSKLKELTAVLKLTEARRIEHFGTDTEEQIVEAVDILSASYGFKSRDAEDPLVRSQEILVAIDSRIAAASADLREFVALQDVAQFNIDSRLLSIRDLGDKLLSLMEPLLEERLAVLKASEHFIAAIADGEEVACPACGSLVSSTDFTRHVKETHLRLASVIAISEQRRGAIGTLCDELATIQTTSKKSDFVRWVERKPNHADHHQYIVDLDVSLLRGACRQEHLRDIEANVIPLLRDVVKASEFAPPDAKQLSSDRQTVDMARTVLLSREDAKMAARAQALSAFLSALEQSVRDFIKVRASTIISDISADVQAMWERLHPGTPIDNVAVYMPTDVDKAIDIRLKFHGVAQESPRLTLSEGYRNSLGLCIFLSLAKREAHDDRPLILDDVIVSLDRHHRGLLIDVLLADFATRQVIILTHDREWYTELRHRVAATGWLFFALLPYESPEIGIRWSHKTTTFDDARAHLDTRPDSAGNDVRKIMDVELALIAEKLRLRLPYLRGEANDMRMAHSLLERIESDGRKCFQIRVGDAYVLHAVALERIESARHLLAAWGNRASHSFDLVRPEAVKLIDSCEAALAAFSCEFCKKQVWFAEASGPEWTQCTCGTIRWRFGKG